MADDGDPSKKDIYAFHDARRISPHQFPLVELPVTRVFEHVYGHYQETKCADYELNYLRCANRVGAYQARTQCRNFYEDMMECIYNTKSRKRWEAIQKERARQGLKDPEVPAPDGYGHHDFRSKEIY